MIPYTMFRICDDRNVIRSFFSPADGFPRSVSNDEREIAVCVWRFVHLVQCRGIFGERTDNHILKLCGNLEGFELEDGGYYDKTYSMQQAYHIYPYFEAIPKQAEVGEIELGQRGKHRTIQWRQLAEMEECTNTILLGSVLIIVVSPSTSPRNEMRVNGCIYLETSVIEHLFNYGGLTSRIVKLLQNLEPLQQFIAQCQDASLLPVEAEGSLRIE